MKRRQLLKNLGLGVGAITLTPAVSSLLHSCSDGTSWNPVFFSKSQIKLLSNLTELKDGRYAYNFKDSKGGTMGVFIHGKPSETKQKALRKHFKDFNPSKSSKNLSATYKKFPNLTTINSI